MHFAVTSIQETTQPIPCTFYVYCRTYSRWMLNRGPFGPLAVHLCDGCLKSVLDTLPEAARALMGAPVRPPATPKEDALHYLRTNRDDPALLEAVAAILEGEGQEVPADDGAAETSTQHSDAENNGDAGTDEARCECGQVFQQPNARAKLGSHRKHCEVAKRAALVK